MKIIVSSSKKNIINFEQIQGIYIACYTESPEKYILYAQDRLFISEHKQLENAKKQLQEIVSIMSADGFVVYQAEDTE